jgi:predicted DNA-binding protein (MmcQ/YjbR family)
MRRHQPKPPAAKVERPALSAFSAEAQAALARLRRMLAGWDGLEEAPSFGHPTFRVGGAPFAVLDRYHEHDCLWLKVASTERDALLAAPGWFPAPYDPRHTALCVRLESIDWRRIRPYLRISYALAAAVPARAARRRSVR